MPRFSFPDAHKNGSHDQQETKSISTQSSSEHVEEKDQELWGTLEQDCLWLVSAKNNKSVSDWSIQVCTRAVERVACLGCERVLP